MKTLKTLAACFAGLVMSLPFVHCAKKPKFEEARIDLLEKMQARKKKLNDKGVLAEVAIGESRNLQTAINKAELEARAKLTRSVEAKTSSLQKKFQEEVGNDYSDHFSQAVKSVSDQVLRGSTLSETPFEQNGEGVYRVFGLMVLDGDLYMKALAAQLEGDKALRDRWRASRAYKELNDEIAAFNEWKRDEAAPPAETPRAAHQGL
jgi:hypothetical protein